MRSLDFSDGFSSATAPTGSGSGVTDHTLLTNIGTNTHPQIDSHIANASNPHSVTASQVGLGLVVNADTTTTANITDALNKRFVTDAEKTVIGNTSGTNTGDKTFDQLSPMTTTGDMIRGGASGTATRLPVGSNGQYMVVSGGIPSWQTVTPALIYTAIVTDQKASGVNGGDFTSGAWRTRDLNTLDDPDSIVSSLSANSFNLTTGTYFIEWSAPAASVDMHQTRLINTTDSLTYLGTVDRVESGAALNSNRSVGAKRVVIASGTKSFQIEHRCATTKTSNGFGVQNPFDLSIYTIVKITKLG